MLVGNLNIFEPNILQSRNHAWTTDFAGPVTRLDFLSLHHCHISEACLVASQIFFLQSTDHGQILYVVPTGTNVFRLIQLVFWFCGEIWFKKEDEEDDDTINGNYNKNVHCHFNNQTKNPIDMLNRNFIDGSWLDPLSGFELGVSR